MRIYSFFFFSKESYKIIFANIVNITKSQVMNFINFKIYEEARFIIIISTYNFVTRYLYLRNVMFDRSMHSPIS